MPSRPPVDVSADAWLSTLVRVVFGVWIVVVAGASALLLDSPDLTASHGDDRRLTSAAE